jgi:hypothetical protein
MKMETGGQRAPVPLTRRQGQSPDLALGSLRVKPERFSAPDSDRQGKEKRHLRVAPLLVAKSGSSVCQCRISGSTSSHQAIAPRLSATRKLRSKKITSGLLAHEFDKDKISWLFSHGGNTSFVTRENLGPIRVQ